MRKLGLVATVFLADRLELADRTRITVSLVAILIPYMLAICGAAFGMGVLNAMNRYKAASFMPSILNLVWIAALVAIAFFPELAVVTRVRIVAGAILFGGFVQFAFMLRCMARAGVSPRLCFSGWRGEKVRLVWRNLAIAAAGAGAIQRNYPLDQVLAQCAAEWAAGVISFAERLMDLPLGVIGVAFGTVLLPTFSRSFAKGKVAGAREVLAAIRGPFGQDDAKLPMAMQTFFDRVDAVKLASYNEIEAIHNWQWKNPSWDATTPPDASGTCL